MENRLETNRPWTISPLSLCGLCIHDSISVNYFDRSPFVGSLCSSQGCCGPYHFVPYTEAMYYYCIPYSCIYDLFCKCCCGEMVYRAPCNNTCGKIFCSHPFLCCIKDSKDIAQVMNERVQYMYAMKHGKIVPVLAPGPPGTVGLPEVQRMR
mmetsp:Transcript_5330/g.11801  ORF Transcript_5330/g.11801 Transcript_5330/m.11801 type:complete len:152 (-) Transcript_5330:276-731(-)